MVCMAWYVCAAGMYVMNLCRQKHIINHWQNNILNCMMYIIKAFHTETHKPALSTHCNPLWPVLTSQPPKETEYCWPVRLTRGMRVGFHTISWKICFTSPFVKGHVKLADHWSKDFKYFTCHVSKQDQTTLKRTNLTHLEKGNIIFKYTLGWDMLQ